MRKSQWLEMSRQKGPFLPVHCTLHVYMGVCTKFLFSPLLFLTEEKKVILFSFPKGLLWGPNQSKFPLCFLLWRGLLLLIARPPGRPSGAGHMGCGQSFFRGCSLFWNRYYLILPCHLPQFAWHIKHFPLRLSSFRCSAKADIFRAFMGKTGSTRRACPARRKCPDSAPTPAPPKVTWGGDAGLAALPHLHLGLCPGFRS